MTKTIVIMAAGKGTRMLPLTENVPKPLISVNNKPFLQYILNDVKSAGYEKIIVIANYKIEQVKKFLEDNEPTAILVDQKDPKGSGHAVLQVKEYIDEDFVVINGDSLFSVRDLRKMREQPIGNYIFGMKSETPEKYGVLVVEDDYLIKIFEKPKEFVGDLVNVGIYRFTKQIFPILEHLEPSGRGEYEIVDGITILTKKDPFKVLSLDDYWVDFGCLEHIPIAEKFIKENNL